MGDGLLPEFERSKRPKMDTFPNLGQFERALAIVLQSDRTADGQQITGFVSSNSSRDV